MLHQELTPPAPKRQKIIKAIDNQKSKMVSAQKLKMVSASFYIPKDNPAKPHGEDAHFVSKSHNAVGVADGVGGWASKGIDAGKYARELMRNSVAAIHNQHQHHSRSSLNPRKVLEEAYANTKSKGSSTACIVTLREDDRCLCAANVGDSGFMVFRNRKCCYVSPVQQRGFNCPYQLGGAGNSDGPESAEEIVVPVVAGDVVVVGTDGLLDNMFAWEIEEILAEESNVAVGKKGAAAEAKHLAWIIAENALLGALDDVCTPFELAAQKYGIDRKGGKMDDITVIVSIIQPSSSSSSLPVLTPINNQI